MKTLFLVSTICLSLIASAQKIKLPAAAKAAFEKAHSGASNIQYEKENGNYEVNFVENGKKMSVVVDAAGKILETEIEMKVNELPTTIQTYIKVHYKDSPLKSGAKIIKADGSTNFEAAIKGKDVIFDATGKFIKESKD
ncbi:MAG: hypothetical protein K2Q21_13730 [Chitinophagaceae bacterium]|nr:hypothetical protein [Chitinophagaceae bacterium]